MTPIAAHDARVPVHASIHVKLIGLTTVMIAAIVGALAFYFSTHEIAALRDEKLARLTAYADLLSKQLGSAVAFADHETAREVLSSSASDRDLESVTLYSATGEILYQHGSPRPELEQVAAIDARIVDAGDRVAIVAPVSSVEGPQGRLVIELSTARFVAREQRVTWTALVVGAAALAFGVLASWLIARSFVRRLRAIGEVATAVASGSTAHEAVVVHNRDEIGVLARAFNLMLARLRNDQAQLCVALDELTAAEEGLAETNRELETRVEQRTAELQAEMAHRSKIELELRHAQKLESVGRLAAGIAHEINTPVQFVSDSCSFLQHATADVLGLVGSYRELVGSLADRPDAIERAHQLESDAELAYLEQQIPQATTRALQGLRRVTEIVGAMKEFAYQDRSAQAPADINRAIDSTLLVAHNEYKYVADVRTEYGELPLVMCHLGELNQVVLNIVVNAAHAIEQTNRGTDKRGEIVIKTTAERGCLEIAISDNGCGIPPEIVDKIFDPFFTTKEIGKGTGQGLAIARSVIVDKHSGRLTVDSVVGRGTTFTIELPIAGNAPATRLEDEEAA